MHCTRGMHLIVHVIHRTHDVHVNTIVSASFDYAIWGGGGGGNFSTYFWEKKRAYRPLKYETMTSNILFTCVCANCQKKNTFATYKFRLGLAWSNQPMNIARLFAMLQYSREQNIRIDCKDQVLLRHSFNWNITFSRVFSSQDTSFKKDNSRISSYIRI